MLRIHHLTFIALFAALVSGALAQEPETFQVPDLSPPVPPDPGQIEELPATEGIPAPAVYPTSTLGLLELLPVPYPHPGTHLWAGYCDGCETLAPCPCPPAWASVDALWLQRQGPDNYLLATDGAQENLWNDQFNFDYELGLRISYGEVVGCTPIEFTYLGLHDWNSTIELDASNLTVPVGPGGGVFDDSDFVQANYASELHSLELNTLQFRSDCVTWVAGVRYIDVEEDFLLRAEDGGDDGIIAITGDNRLLGLQVGADYSQGCDGWCWTMTGRAGVFANFTERDLAIVDEGQPANNLRNESSDTEFAFVGQFGVGLTRHLGCGIKLRGGYELLWIQGLTLAAEQLGAGGGGFAVGSVNAKGDTLYDGGYLGFEWNR